MSVDIDLSDYHEGMLNELRDQHGDGIDDHLRKIVEAEIHESYQQLRDSETNKPRTSDNLD